MLILRLGDPHIKISNLADAEKLMAYTEFIAKDKKVDRIEILGDLFHNHAVLRLEILEFWNKWIVRLAEQFETIVLVGNHDQTGDYKSTFHALAMFKHIVSANLHIIDEPTRFGIFAYAPYIHHEEEFLVAVNPMAAAGSKVLICHQTFEGSKYDNGMYAPDGFNLEKVDFDLIIPGHIHTRQRFGNGNKMVIYPGTGKWDTASDANEEKGLWLVKHDKDGKILTEEFFSTEQVVTPIYERIWKEGEECPPIPETGRATYELIGTSEWVKKAKDLLKDKVATRSKITDKVRPESRKGVEDGLDSWVKASFETVTGIDKTELVAWMKENSLV